MAMSTTKNVRLTFETTSGSIFTITLPQPKESVTTTVIETAMDLVINKNIFLTSGGELTGKRDIKIIDTTTNDLYDPMMA